MEFENPANGKVFTIADDWLARTEFFKTTLPLGDYYEAVGSTAPLTVVPIEAIQPPWRSRGVAEFDEERMISIMRAMLGRLPLPPLEVHSLMRSRYSFELYDGYHRYHSALALGFSSVPISCRERFDLGPPTLNSPSQMG